MINIQTPNGFVVNVPENIDEDRTPRFNVNNNLNEAIKYYQNNGYVIFSNCVSDDICNEIKNIWEKKIKPFKGKIYRQTTAKVERNIFNKNNWIMNPILNIQSLNPFFFSELRNAVDTEIFSNISICKALKSILGEKPKIVQSMYFEGNSVTWEHQDSYYLDSEKIGEMTAGWLALEEIKADAGRFFICPKSHLIEYTKQNINNNIADKHNEYVGEIISTIKSRDMKIIAPYMNAGDILFWNSLTIHGSMDSQNKNYSRSSITMHAIPESRKFLQFHSKKKILETEDLGNSLIYRPKDQSKILNRCIFLLESLFPSIFYWLKKKIIKILIKNS